RVERFGPDARGRRARRAAGCAVRLLQSRAHAAAERARAGDLAAQGPCLQPAAGLLAVLPARLPARAHTLPVRHHAAARALAASVASWVSSLPSGLGFGIALAGLFAAAAWLWRIA